MAIIGKKKKRMFAIFNYGGGMRGLIPARLMAEIEARTGLHMADMVDIFSGPSTGAILNAALTRPHERYPNRPKYRARHLVRFYEREGLNIFPPDSFRAFRGILHDFNNRTLKLGQLNNLMKNGHYDPRNLAGPLRRLYGDTKLHDSLRTLIIPAYNIDSTSMNTMDEDSTSSDFIARREHQILDEGGHSVWLKHIKHDYPSGTKDKVPDCYIFDAVMASCAAPTYFPCHHFTVKYPDHRGVKQLSAIDGNMFDNPCISYLGAIRRHVPADTELIMIVFGTGYTNKSVTRDEWNRFGSLGVVDPANDLPLINIFFHASESALMDGFEEEMGDNLYIFNKSMIDQGGKLDTPDKQIDNASTDNLKSMKGFAESIIEENQKQFDDLCHMLVSNYDNKK